MHILHITTFLQGGAGRIILNLALNQIKSGHQVSVITSKTSEPGYCNYSEYIDEFKNNGIELIEIDSTFKRDLYLNFNVVTYLQMLLRRSPIDIIHAHAAIPALIGIIARSGSLSAIPIIQTMHGWGLNKNAEQEKMDIAIMQGLDKVVTASNNDKNFLEMKGINSERLVTIYNGIDSPQMDDDPESLNGPENAILLSDLKKFKEQGLHIIGCIGTVCERKNQSLLLEAFHRLSNNARCMCLFIGEGELIPLLQSKALAYGLEDRVKFYGYQKNASRYINRFDCLVLPSISEGLGLTIIEAFRNRVPVIVSDIPVFKEVVENRKSGFIFESNNANSLTVQLSEFLSSSKEVLKLYGENGYRTYLRLFTIKTMIENYKELYSYFL